MYNCHSDVVQLTNSVGAVTREYDYDAFGVEKESEPLLDAEGNEVPDLNPFRYCAEYFDEETGSIYLRARYYDPVVGRFLSQDPIRAGLNWYTYANGNPIMYFDPTGLSTYTVPTQDGRYTLLATSNKEDTLGLIMGLNKYTKWILPIGNGLSGIESTTLEGCDPKDYMFFQTELMSFMDRFWNNKALGYVGDFFTIIDTYNLVVDWDNNQRDITIYNHLNNDVFISDSRQMVSAKLLYAQASIDLLLEKGLISIKTGTEIHGKEKFTTMWYIPYTAYDPLTGREIDYLPENYYFVANSEKAYGLLADIENTLSKYV